MLVIKDFATTILASALTAAATSVVVSDAGRLPALSAGDYYYLVLQKFTDRTSVEVVKVTGAAGNTLTVVRAQAGTTAKSFAIGDYAEQRVTVGTFSEYIAQSVAGKVDKSGGYAEQSFGLLNTGDLVKAAVGISYDATNGHGTILSGGEGANKATPYVALRPLGVADSSVQLKYAQDGSLILSGGSRYVETGLLSMKHPADANGWPNAVNADGNNYNNRARGKVHVNNNALYFIADGTLNARRFGIQSGHEDPGYATSYGVLDLNPFGGNVRVNGGLVYHTNYVPTPAAVGALALSGGTITGSLDQNIAGYGGRMTASAGIAYLQGGKVGGDTTDQKLRITGINSVPLTEFDIITSGHGVAKINGARIYTEQYVPTPDVLGVVPQARTINSKPLTANITLSAADVGAVAKIGDTMTGGLTFVNADCELGWVFNSDYAKIGFKNTADGDTDSYMWFKTGDNGNEYFKWQSVSGANTTDWMSLKPTGLVVAAGVTAPTFTGALAGNAATATKLATARQINGTDFNGSDNITTANWGTARTLTIGNAAKSVNGAGNVSWSLSEIGALPVTGGTVSGVLGVTGELHLVGYSAYDMADIVWIAPDGTERGRLWIWGTIGADNSLTWRSGAGGAFHKIYHEGNKPTAADVGAMADGGSYGTIHFSNWVRTTGDTGWFNATYGGGIHMVDTTWIRTYNGKKFYIANGEVDALNVAGGIYAGGNGNFGDVYIRSDKRLKTNLVPLSDALEKVCKLAGYEYDKKKCLSATEYDVHEAGLIAQDVQAVLPAATSEVNSATASGNEENVLTISHGGVIALLVEAVKELSEKVKELEHGRT